MASEELRVGPPRRVGANSRALSSLLWAVVALYVGCSRSSPASSAGPTPPTGTPGVVAGRVAAVATGEPVAGALVTSGSVSVSTDANGSFSMPAPSANRGVWATSVTAPEYLARQVWLRAAGTRNDVSIDLISELPPFSLVYYREFVRGVLDRGQFLTLQRWTTAPKIFFRTTTTDTNDPVPDEVIDTMEEIARREMPWFTGGRFLPAGMARGPVPPTPAAGWIIVSSFTDGIPGSPTAGGTGQVGTNPGDIRLVLNTRKLAESSGCFFGMTGAFAHELVHALGFWHVAAGTWTVGNQCLQPTSEAEYHARIAYSRPIGNLDPDTDTANTTLLTGNVTAPQVVE